MPGNIIKINDSIELSWYVGDSKMKKLIKYLNEIGLKTAGYRYNKKPLGKEGE